MRCTRTGARALDGELKPNYVCPVRIRDLQPGIIIDHAWRIDASLGGGGMGAVFACTNPQTGQRAAVKLLHEHVAIDPRLRARFVNEGRALSRVPHPGVVKFLGEGDFAGVPYIVMELAEGSSLKAHAISQGGTLSMPQLDPIVMALLDVLAAVHDAGIIHRDIKPDNVVVAEGQRVRLVDFGIARIEEESGTTTTGTTLGTPAFMAPEQVLGREGRVDKRADLYSVGAVIHRLLSGSNLHHPATGAELLIAMGTRQAPSILTSLPQLPVAAGRVIDRALMFDREARFTSAREMSSAWQSALATPGTSAPKQVTKTLPMAPAVPTAKAWSRRWLIAAAALAMVLSSFAGAAIHRIVTTGGLRAGMLIPVEEQDTEELAGRLEEYAQGFQLLAVSLSPTGTSAVGQTSKHRGVTVVCLNAASRCEVTKHSEETPYGDDQGFDIRDVAWDQLERAIREAKQRNRSENGAGGVVEVAMYNLWFGVPRWTIVMKTKAVTAQYCFDTRTKQLDCSIPRPSIPTVEPSPQVAPLVLPSHRSPSPAVEPLKPAPRSDPFGLDSRF